MQRACQARSRFGPAEQVHPPSLDPTNHCPRPAGGGCALGRSSGHWAAKLCRKEMAGRQVPVRLVETRWSLAAAATSSWGFDRSCCQPAILPPRAQIAGLWPAAPWRPSGRPVLPGRYRAGIPAWSAAAETRTSTGVLGDPRRCRRQPRHRPGAGVLSRSPRGPRPGGIVAERSRACDCASLHGSRDNRSPTYRQSFRGFDPRSDVRRRGVLGLRAAVAGRARASRRGTATASSHAGSRMDQLRAQEQGTRALKELRGSVRRAFQCWAKVHQPSEEHRPARGLAVSSLPLADFHGQLLRVV